MLLWIIILVFTVPDTLLLLRVTRKAAKDVQVIPTKLVFAAVFLSMVSWIAYGIGGLPFPGIFSILGGFFCVFLATFFLVKLAYDIDVNRVASIALMFAAYKVTVILLFQSIFRHAPEWLKNF